MGRLDGKVAVITGSGAGLGAEAAKLFAQEGCAVVVNDVNEAAGQQVVSEIQKAGGKAVFIAGDVRSTSSVESLYAGAKKAFGKVNVLYNNAGVSPGDDDGVVNTADEIWDLVLDINVKGVARCCRAGIPYLREAGGGSIINVASFVATLGAATPQIAYTASKGAVLSMTREIAIIHARERIRANALSPGPVRTALLEKFLSTEEKRQRRLVHIPMGRFGEAREIAQAAVFLASDESSFVTGADFRVDGGITAAYVTPEGPPK
ncbi:MAG TPA: glucose 1-dehydrogenase [Gemmatimonadales bacterium]|nr:glucose 1-dehydrogenase [Gemmatimonadales bacterium]